MTCREPKLNEMIITSTRLFSFIASIVTNDGDVITSNEGNEMFDHEPIWRNEIISSQLNFFV